MMQERYRRNLHSLSEAEMALLQSSTVAVVGCGGLGGYVLESLGRLGVGSLIGADGDRFEESNLNRQILADSSSLGRNKAEAAGRRMERINPLVRFRAVAARVDSSNGPALLEGADLVVDATDDIPTRLDLQDLAERMGIPLVHGAVGGWYGQVAALLPGDRTLDRIYAPGGTRPARERGIEDRLGNLSFGVAAVASFQAAEAVKLLLGRGESLRRRLLILDFLENDFEIVELPACEA